MSQFSTGELAKAAEVSVRTVQYYDQRGILTPSEVTEGGRRIYHESDLERLQVICFLRDLDFSIKQIKKLLNDINFRWKICQTFHVLWKIKNHGVICS